MLASNVDALPEVVRDGETGMLFPAEDPHALATFIRALDRQKLAQMEKAGRADSRRGSRASA